MSSQSELAAYIKKQKDIQSLIGTIKIIGGTPLGQGANGVVYAGTMNNAQLAIKFLTNCESEKLKRFKAEYLNTNYYRDTLKNVVNYLHYDILNIENSQYPFIIMKRYSLNLKAYRESMLNNITWKEVYKLFKELLQCLKSMEECNIIHRDLKPENILLDDNKSYIIADFGIAHFCDQHSPLVVQTKKGDRLCNYNFSASEQLNGGKISYATDLYAIAQIIYWFVFGTINRGVGGSRFFEKFDEPESYYMDSIIYSCLNNNAEKRPQSVKDIERQWQGMKAEHENKIDPFNDMGIFRAAVAQVLPEMFEKVYFTKNAEYISELIQKISSVKTNKPLWYNTGRANNEISNFENFEEGKYILNNKLIKITGVWGYFGIDEYQDVLIFQFENLPAFEMEEGKFCHIIIADNDVYLPGSADCSGYIRYKGKVYNAKELNIKHIYVEPEDEDRYFIVSTFYQGSNYFRNDIFLRELQQYGVLSEKLIVKYRQNINLNIRDEVQL